MPLIPILLVGGGAIAGFFTGWGTSKASDKVFTYAVTGGALFIAYKLIKK